MPNLYNTALGQNTRRVRLSDSNLGTRRIQFYQVTVYGLTDAFIDGIFGNYRYVQNEGSIDSEDAYEYVGRGNRLILEAIVRGVQKMSELYIVGEWDYYQEDPDYNDLEITIGVSADTVESHKEQQSRPIQLRNPNSESIEHAVYDAVDDFDPQGGYDYIEVIPVQIAGSSTDPTGGYGLGRNHPLNVQVKLAKKAASLAARKTPPQFKKPR